MGIKHAKVSAKADGGDASLILPSDWNAGHIIQDLSLGTPISPAQLTSNQNDWNPTGLSTALIIRLSGDSSFRYITGIAGGADGRILILHNVGTNTVLLANQNTGSTSSNRFDFGLYDMPLFPGEAIWLQYDATSARWRIISEENSMPVAGLGLYYLNDMFGIVADSYLSSVVSGTGAANSLTVTAGLAGHPGVVTHQTGTTTTGRAAMATTNFSPIILGGNWYWRFEAIFRIGALSDATNTYTYRVGFLDSVSAESSDGVFLRYTHGTNSGQWQIVARGSNVETATNTTSAVVANTWYRGVIIVNPLGTSAEAFINGVSIGTVTSNLPTGTGKNTGFGSLMIKSAGTSNVNIDLDSIEILAYANAPRS
jgi:predicted secreted protein